MVKYIFFLLCLVLAEYGSAQTFYPLAGSKLILGGGTSGTTQLILKAPSSVFTPYTITFPTATPTNTFLLQTDGSGQLSWADPNSLGYITSLITDAPLTGSGTSASHLKFSNQTDNLVFASPDGSTGAPSFRALASADIPNLNVSKLTAGTLPIARGGTGATTLTAHGVVIGNGTSAVAVTSAGTAGQILESGGSTADPSFQSAPIGIYGDGSDGSLTYDGTTTILGMAPAANVYTLTRDIFPSSITINNGVTIKANGARIYCNGTITNNGTIHNNGNNANNATAGAATAATNILGIGQAGGAGGNSGAGTNTAATANAGGGAGGVGGISGAGQAGGTVAGVVAPLAANGGASVFRSFNCANTGMILTTTVAKVTGGSGGSGGGGSGANNGGGGGGGGGVLLINAWKIDNTSGTISANGGNGGNGTGANGGSGGGGGGGLVLLIYHSYVGNAATATGGAAGAAKTGTGVLGSAGNVGKIVTLQN